MFDFSNDSVLIVVVMLFCIREEKRMRKKNTHKTLTNGLEVFKTVEKP